MVKQFFNQLKHVQLKCWIQANSSKITFLNCFCYTVIYYKGEKTSITNARQMTLYFLIQVKKTLVNTCFACIMSVSLELNNKVGDFVIAEIKNNKEFLIPLPPTMMQK